MKWSSTWIRASAAFWPRFVGAGLRSTRWSFSPATTGANAKGRNAPFSGFKGGTYEGGIRVPAIVRWPGVLPAGGTSDQVAITFDLSASILAAAQVEPPAGRRLDGIDVLRYVAERRSPRRRTLFWRQRRGEKTWRAVRDGDLKYVSLTDGSDFEEHLFDLARDPGEKNDLATDRPAALATIKRLLTVWEEDVKPAR